MKKIIPLLLAFTLLCGCAKCISTETTSVDAKVISTSYKKDYYTYVYNFATKTHIAKYHDAEYIVVVEYDGVQYKIDDVDSYYKSVDRAGDDVTAILKTYKYDDGSTKNKIVRIE